MLRLLFFLPIFYILENALELYSSNFILPYKTLYMINEIYFSTKAENCQKNFEEAKLVHYPGLKDLCICSQEKKIYTGLCSSD